MARMMTFGDLKKAGTPDAGDEGTDMYAGGETSGVAVRGRPDKHRGVGGAEVDGIFNTARKTAEVPRPEDTKEDDGGAKITFYKNGFVVDDGPLRGYDDPENKAFLAACDRGEVPAELRKGRPGDRNIAVTDKRGEDYRPPTPPAYTAFSGSGMTAGSSTGGVGLVAAGMGASGELVVDDSKPTTRIRVAMAAGGRKVFKFNTTHTVGDLQNEVGKLCPGTVFVLLGGVPPKPLDDASLTLEAAGLLNSSVRQRNA